MDCMWGRGSGNQVEGRVDMEMDGATFLYTLATLMITFAGFSALLFVIRQAAGAKLSLLDRFIVRNIMTYIFVLTAAALLPELLDSFYIPSWWVWQVSGLLFAVPIDRKSVV